MAKKRAETLLKLQKCIEESGRKPFAIGVHEYLPEFSLEHNADTFANGLGNWLTVVRNKVNKGPDEKGAALLFNQEGWIPKRGRDALAGKGKFKPTGTDKEFKMILDNPEAQERTFWFGKPNPITPGINEL